MGYTRFNCSKNFPQKLLILGQLQESAFYVSATSILGDVFIGYNNLERIRIDEREISSSIVYETGFELRLDHSPFLAVDANFCRD